MKRKKQFPKKLKGRKPSNKTKDSKIKKLIKFAKAKIKNKSKKLKIKRKK